MKDVANAPKGRAAMPGAGGFSKKLAIFVRKLDADSLAIDLLAADRVQGINPDHQSRLIQVHFRAGKLRREELVYLPRQPRLEALEGRAGADLVPLAKICADDDRVVDVFELVIGGKEIAPGYSELNDPLEQRKRLEAQSGAEAQKVAEEFLLALEHGMPPAGGMGLGIDRLVMILTGAEAIRDVILFPQLRPKSDPSAGIGIP